MPAGSDARSPAITVLGATGPVGRALTELLVSQGRTVVAIGRDPARLTKLPPTVILRIAEFNDSWALREALADARLVVCCNNVGFLPAILDALPHHGVERLVVMGSTRCFSKVPDATAEAVRRAGDLLTQSSVPSVLLLSTLIYGTGQGVVERLAQLAARIRLHVLAGGGSGRIQPIHLADVAAALAASVTRDEAPGMPLVIAGRDSLSWRELAARVAAERGRKVWVVALPVWIVHLLSAVPLAGIRTVGRALARQLEDQCFDLTAMRLRLGVEPRPFDPAA